ncbi:MAG: sugar ABC transporter permease [Candidatus Rokubacteria bacterium]|nr:sugar ABC transporter permease [Candidatus Rokubacteria bacterium]
MTASPNGGEPEGGARAAAVPIAGRAGVRAWWRTPTARRLAFGYTLLSPAILYVALLVGAPFLFSLYLAVSDASVGDPFAEFVWLENFKAAWESPTFWIALRNSILVTVVAAIFKSLLGTTLAFLLLQPFRGKKLIRGLVVIPFTVPSAVSVLGWKWMYDSQFSVVNWALNRVGLISAYGTEGWPIWLGQPHLALAAIIAVNVWRSFPFTAIVLLAGFTAVPQEVIDAAKVDGTTFMQRFRFLVIPMIAPILFVGLLFDTVFTLSDISVVLLLTNGGPGNATQILPTLAYQIGILAGALGRGAAISLFLFPLLLPAMILLLRNLKRREW